MLIKARRLINPATRKEINSSPWVQVDKEYLVLGLFIVANEGISVYIQSEYHRQPGFFLLSGFEIVTQEFPSSWVRYFNTDNSVRFIPEPWNYETFFEEVEDGNLKAVELFNQEAEKMYREEGLV